MPINLYALWDGGNVFDQGDVLTADMPPVTCLWITASSPLLASPRTLSEIFAGMTNEKLGTHAS
jgi:hypothetical protein